mmetsp:Transcript_26834/g.42497  ORF Transcript_26834/g.42497 Transcript_26834/m.42497 type:complete len:102 (+) Transcript_26834:515-820(+)
MVLEQHTGTLIDRQYPIHTLLLMVYHMDSHTHKSLVIEFDLHLHMAQDNHIDNFLILFQWQSNQTQLVNAVDIHIDMFLYSLMMLLDMYCLLHIHIDMYFD